MSAARADDDDAVAQAAEELYGATLGSFVAERKRLADARKAAGDKAGAAVIAKLARPAMSAWAVNRLWREAREEMDGLIDAGARVRAGDRGALEQQRAYLAKLRSKAAGVLVDGGHAATPATIHRIATTLQALSATGTWAPDRPGQLVADRDPPGFDVMMGAVIDGAAPIRPPAPARAPERPAPLPAAPKKKTKAELRAEAAAARALARAAERAMLVKSAAAAHRDLEDKTAVRDRARTDVDAAETALARARAKLATAEAAQDEAADRAGRADAAIATLDAEAEADRGATAANDNADDGDGAADE